MKGVPCGVIEERNFLIVLNKESREDRHSVGGEVR
jgi:hypothetical protein